MQADRLMHRCCRRNGQFTSQNRKALPKARRDAGAGASLVRHPAGCTRERRDNAQADRTSSRPIRVASGGCCAVERQWINRQKGPASTALSFLIALLIVGQWLE